MVPKTIGASVADGLSRNEDRRGLRKEEDSLKEVFAAVVAVVPILYRALRGVVDKYCWWGLMNRQG